MHQILFLGSSHCSSNLIDRRVGREEKGR